MKKSFKSLLVILPAVFLLTACVSNKNIEETVDFEPEKIDFGQTTEQSVTLREKIGQLFIIRPECIEPEFTLEQIHYDYNFAGSIELTDSGAATYKNYPAGGFVLFARNIKNPAQVKKYTSQLKKLSDNKMLMCIDEEGGRVARLANSTGFNLIKYTDVKSIGETENPEKAFEMGFAIGSYLKDFGFNLDFAPVADVDTNPKNPVIGRRSFSSNPEIAGKMDIQFLNGLHKAGIAGCLKHFPGHGDTKTDTHKGMAETTKTWNELKECELIPFKMGIKNGAKMIMTAHIMTPRITKNALPSTLSPEILTEKLRKELGFNGVIITDGMEMRAISDFYDAKSASVKAILAGADIILIPYDYRTAFDSVVEAVEKGIISEKRIDESLERISALKAAILE